MRRWRTYLVRPPQIVTKWFLTFEEYEVWKGSLPIRDQINADLYAHVGHTSLAHVPQECTACALNESMYQVITQKGRLLS